MPLKWQPEEVSRGASLWGHDRDWLPEAQQAEARALKLKAAEGAMAIDGPGGVIGPIAAPLFRDHLLAFELTSMLLLTAIVGAVVIGKRKGADDAR